MYWLNGVPNKKLSLGGRFFLFGDGFFTTARLRKGVIELLDWHLDRLILSGQRLLFSDWDITALCNELAIAAEYGKDGLIQIVIMRSDCREGGYGFKKDIMPFRIIYFSTMLKEYKSNWHRYGIHLVQSSIRLSRNPLLAGIKHLNRLEQIMVRMSLSSQSLGDEALVLDTEGNIVECCAANIFWRIGYNVFTPSLTYAGISGVMRRLVLRLLPKLGYSLQEVIEKPDVLEKVDEVFISNALLPLISVNSFEKYKYMDRTLCRLLLSHIIKS